MTLKNPYEKYENNFKTTVLSTKISIKETLNFKKNSLFSPIIMIVFKDLRRNQSNFDYKEVNSVLNKLIQF